MHRGQSFTTSHRSCNRTSFPSESPAMHLTILKKFHSPFTLSEPVADMHESTCYSLVGYPLQMHESQVCLTGNRVVHHTYAGIPLWLFQEKEKCACWQKQLVMWRHRKNHRGFRSTGKTIFFFIFFRQNPLVTGLQSFLHHGKKEDRA